MGDAIWSVVLPVKRLAAAKSRLRGALDGVRHEELALALASDTVAAVLACPLVAEAVVVTADPVAGEVLAGLGARTVAEADGDGLNAALVRGAATVAAGRPVAALTADLPALRPAELAAALRTVGTGRCFVPDAAGTGTVLLAAAGTALLPGFGPDSARRHAGSGARRLDGRWPSLRRDVDTVADLAAAVRLGLGRHTAALCPTGVPC
ncbi:2-phospho-L-lactate guanylyltransferase [Micromonospora sp. NBC_01813]|uniref:2-phospho-L-lactate guanylyltransferase n=1 Tax=Micromonospora sp. NBC_01813 TaxID=2975988 RepID=UPI002DDB93AF|nr:2-phospho-L-lactate guanylyltransferase [Micromonospora sp. NBC_01813]WSA11835.1 2-phospho-L-lactate guanylyltransferase [Micromonospora sp. NBC_01813]